MLNLLLATLGITEAAGEDFSSLFERFASRLPQPSRRTARPVSTLLIAGLDPRLRGRVLVVMYLAKLAELTSPPNHVEGWLDPLDHSRDGQ